MPVVSDLAAAWQRCVDTTSHAVAHGLSSHNSQVGELDAWMLCTEQGDLRYLARMPDKAQRELSASVVSLEVHAFRNHLEGATRVDATRRLVLAQGTTEQRKITSKNSGFTYTMGKIYP